MKLSSKHQEAVDTAAAHGGRLVYERGGFWTYPGCPRRGGTAWDAQYPSWHVATGTVRALVTRGVMTEVEHRQTRAISGRVHSYPVAVELAAEPINGRESLSRPDRLGNRYAREGCDRCYCGCKYWEHDRCVDCGTSIAQLLRDPEWEGRAS